MALCQELLWMAEHLEASDGVLLLNSLEWSVLEVDLVVYTDASATGMGIWCPSFLRALYSPIVTPQPSCIFFFKAWAVVSALSFASSLNQFHHIIIFTDNSNTVNMFNTLHAKPDYNPLLITAMNILLDHNIQLCVLHIPGADNTIADTISHSKFDIVYSRFPTAALSTFTPIPLSNGSTAV
ncbi:hypothetical protein D9758_009736 [Tetrapyrgos nigripes]|uniref:Uncharacterized protein n=1 Tax=Tetrapyrgos nigripes TaxID=182062 RepID=A0A8H5GKI9_9AGAR|nr:hypothetical protein D9758_009736 [Tetrapyrgos nigripes]